MQKEYKLFVVNYTKGKEENIIVLKYKRCFGQ